MFRKCLSLIVVLFLLVPSIVEAKSMFEENFKSEQNQLKSENTALLSSLAATAIPVALGGTLLFGNSAEAGLALVSMGIILGPSTGHFYANHKGRGFAGIATRIVIVAGATGIGCIMDKDAHPDVSGLAILGMMIIGGAISSLHGIYDICTAPSSVRNYNESLKNKTSLMLIPQIDPYNESYGVSLVCNF